jgi:phage tail sheath gpL-like
VVANDPLQAIVLDCLKPAPRPCQFTWNERNRTILQSGGSTYTYNDANQVVLENGVTENLTTDAGAATDANRRVETQFANSYLRWSLNNMLQSKYPRSRLAGNGTTGLPNNVVTPDSVAMSILSFAKSDWIAKGIIEDYAGFKSSLVVERSTTDCNTINIFMKPKLVNVLVAKATQICYVVC